MPPRRVHDPVRKPMRHIRSFTYREGLFRLDEAYLSDNQVDMLVRRIRRSRKGERVCIEMHTADKDGNLP